MNPSSSGQHGLSIDHILRESKHRWLKGYEVLCILQNYSQYNIPLRTTPTMNPESGCFYLFKKKQVKFRKDGVNWQKQRDGKTVRESHEKLKVGGVRVISCCYTRAADSFLHRRIYWLLGDPSAVLVHYLEITTADGKMDKESLDDDLMGVGGDGGEKGDSSGEQSYDEVSDSPLLPSDMNHKAPAEEDIDSGEEKQLFQQFSNPAFASGSFLDFVNSFGESPLQTPPLVQDRLTPAPKSATHRQQQRQQKILQQKYEQQQQQHQQGQQVSPMPSATSKGVTPDKLHPNSASNTQLQLHSKTPPMGGSIGRLAKIVDFAPKWDNEEGSSTVLIIGPDFQMGVEYFCMFDQEEVPAEVIQAGVLRTQAPAHEVGVVTFCITRGNFTLFSEVRHFEYRPSLVEEDHTPETDFKMRIVQILESIEHDVSQAKGGFSDTQSMMDTLGGTISAGSSPDELESVFIKIAESLAGELEGLDVEGLDFNVPDDDGFTLLHCASFLGFHSLASFLVHHGADPNTKEENGLTPFHIAMKNMDQKLIKILVDFVDVRGGVGSLEGITDCLDDLGLQLKPDDAATAIQSAFRGHRVREELSEERSAAMKIQQFYRTHRRRFWDKLGVAASGGHHASLKNHRTHRAIENEAAQKIQSAFKVYRTRRDQSHLESNKRRTFLVAKKRK